MPAARRGPGGRAALGPLRGRLRRDRPAGVWFAGPHRRRGRALDEPGGREGAARAPGERARRPARGAAGAAHARQGKAFAIDDALLFGCLLQDGEYLSPAFPVLTADPTHARDRWQDVVRHYPQPYVTVVKPGAGSAPFRVEFNATAAGRLDELAVLLYHSSALLPNYGFPVGFSIVARYARVPRWVTGAAGDLLAYRVLTHLLRERKVEEFRQARQAFARLGRSFFRRPA